MSEPVILGEEPDTPVVLSEPIEVLNKEPVEILGKEATKVKANTKQAQHEKRLAALLETIAPVSVDTDKLKVLIYGEPGTGKTTFIGTAPSSLLIDIERGSRALLNVKNVDVDVMKFISIKQVESIVELLKIGDPAFDKYETISMDSGTEMQSRLIDQQLRELGGGAPVYKADWGVYGANTQRLRMLVSAFRDIDKNLIMTAHAKVEKDDQTGLTMVKPALTPALLKTVTGTFDIVAYLRINGKGERVLRVNPSKTVVAKSRLRLPDEMLNPTWANLTEKGNS